MSAPKCVVCAAYKRELDKVRTQYQSAKQHAKEAKERAAAARAIENKRGEEVSIKWLRARIATLEAGRMALAKREIKADEAALRELLAIRLARGG